MSDVLVVGAGSVGLTLACELARHGARCRIIDRAPEPLPYCRAIGVTPRTLEVWDDMGIAREMIDAGLWLIGLRSIIEGHPPQDIVAPPLDLPFAQLGLPQYETERLLTRHLARFGTTVERGASLTALSQDQSGVTVQLERGGVVEAARFRYLVGCDGAHSAVRRLLDIGFEGEAYPWPFMLGDVHIGWDVPYGMAARAMRLRDDGPPDMFIAIPLPEPGRYRISMLAPERLVPPGGSEHGIQAELAGPLLEDLQAVADDLLPERPRLSGLRWSSVFRISMRLATAYRRGRCLIAGDAAHIHPPTGGQGMNTGIQDAYNLAWKLALVLRGASPEALLDSYEAERRPVGADVVARTRAASEGYGREGSAPPDRLADTQIRITYRGTPWVGEGAGGKDGIAAGDRAPDVGGLMRRGLGFPLRLFDILRGTDHVLIVHRAEPDSDVGLLAGWGHSLVRALKGLVRVVVVTESEAPREEPGLVFFCDATGGFAATYGSTESATLVRPDGHVGWRGNSWRDPGLQAYLDTLFPGSATIAC